MNSIKLDGDEEYDKCCGEIFLTTKGSVIFHCTLCTLICKEFDIYANHVKSEHLWTNDIYFNDNYSEIDENCESVEILERTEEYPVKESTEQHQSSEVEHSENEEVEILEDHENLIEKLLKYNNKQEKYKQTQAKISGDNLSNIRQSRFTQVRSSIRSYKSGPVLLSNARLKTASNSFGDRKKMKLDAELYHKLPPCDRPQLKYLRNLSSALTDENRKHKCPYCVFAAKDKTNLWNHIKRHSNNKPHQCEHCPKSFHTRYELIFHTRYHTGERPYLCADCGRAFVTKEQLKQHEKRHSNQRDYICSECHKAFYSRQELRGHMTVHTKETPFKCDLCQSMFTRKKALYAHKKLHENKKSYKCHICGVGYNQGAGLYLHMKTKHKVVKKSSTP